MQAEIDTQETRRAVYILGINAIGLESGNAGMTTDRALPWLQPAAGADPWTLWHVEYRDVVILGPGNEPSGTYNLTAHDLSDPTNYAALRDLLLAAANN
jgi:hypothetical protein